MPHESRIPSFPGYQFIEKIGQGGMGAVYRVRQKNVDFALKTILHHNEIELLSRFEREALAAAAVDKHPNIVSIHKLELNAQPPFILMDFVEGQSLDQWIAQDEPWPLEKVIQFLEPLTKALDHMHSKGVIHRDLKPANILIRDHDKAPLITDFGLAKVMQLDSLTQSEQRFGTPNYMAPEQFEGKPAKAASDLWALAVISYELLSGGQRPFLGESSVILAQNVLTKPPRPFPQDIKLNSELRRFFQQKAFAKHPDDRVKSAALLLEALQAEPQRPSRALYFVGAGMALASLLGGSGYLYVRGERDAKAHRSSEDIRRQIQSLRDKLTSARHKKEVEQLILTELLALVTNSPHQDSPYLAKIISEREALQSKIERFKSDTQSRSKQKLFRKGHAPAKAYKEVLLIHSKAQSDEGVDSFESPLLEALIFARRKQFPKLLAALKRSRFEAEAPFKFSYSLALIQLKLGKYQEAIESFKVKCPEEYKDAVDTALLEARARNALNSGQIPRATLLFYKVQQRNAEFKIEEKRFSAYLRDGHIDLNALGQYCNKLCMNRQSGSEFVEYLVESLKQGVFLHSFTEDNLKLIELHDRSEFDSRKKLLNPNRSAAHRFWHDYYQSFKESGKESAGESSQRDLFQALQSLTTRPQLPGVYRSLIHFQIARCLRQRSKSTNRESWTTGQRRQFFAELTKARDLGYPAPDQIDWEWFRAREDELRASKDAKRVALELIPLIQKAIRGLRLRAKLTREKTLTQGRPRGQAYLQVSLNRLPKLLFAYYGKLARAQHCARQLREARESLKLAFKHSPYLRCPPNTLEILIELKELRTLLSIKEALVKEQQRQVKGSRPFNDLGREITRTESAIEDCRKRL